MVKKYHIFLEKRNNSAYCLHDFALFTFDNLNITTFFCLRTIQTK